jgi:peptidoglycan/xylan/chitin deacetylase (PgdA/CDA1 family)
MAFGSLGAGALSMRNRLRLGPEIRVLTYHRFGDAVREPFRVSAESFEAQVRHLATSGTALSLSDVDAFVAGELLPPRDAVLLTIDDGSVSVHRIALPILREYGVPAVLFTVAGAVGGEALPGGSEPFVSWDELEELVDCGVDVQSHSMTHRSMRKLSREEASDEAARSKELLEQRLGRPVTSFAYPYGTRGDFDESTARVLVESGYRTIFTSQHGAIQPGHDPTVLPRVKIEGGEGMAMFRLAVAGGLDGWAAIDRTLHSLQAPADA